LKSPKSKGVQKVKRDYPKVKGRFAPNLALRVKVTHPHVQAGQRPHDFSDVLHLKTAHHIIELARR
jgi:hypothetical protein